MSRKRALRVAMGLTLAALLLAPLASSLPDGLETVADRIGFAADAARAVPAPLADYAVGSWGRSPLGTLAAGLVGALAVFVLVGLVGFAGRRRGASRGSEEVGSRQ